MKTAQNRFCEKCSALPRRVTVGFQLHISETQCMATTGRKGGRPSRGNRDQFLLRLPVELAGLVREAAAADGMTVTDFMNRACAVAVDRPDLGPQEGLPLRRSA